MRRLQCSAVAKITLPTATALAPSRSDQPGVDACELRRRDCPTATRSCAIMSAADCQNATTAVALTMCQCLKLLKSLDRVAGALRAKGRAHDRGTNAPGCG